MKFYQLLFAVVCFINQAVSQVTEKPNFIFIICDDLNTWIEGYDGLPQTITPHIWELQQMGTTFTNAYANCVVCAPSRTSLMTGKTMHYTQVKNNLEYTCGNFRDNFDTSLYIQTLPQYLKDSAGYFTYSLNKIYHCPQFYQDYDSITTDICEKKLSWNMCRYIDNEANISSAGNSLQQGVEHFSFAAIDSTLTPSMQDYLSTNEAAAFFSAYNANPAAFCNKPFFLGVGYHKPHSNLYIPEQYFLPDYVKDFFSTTLNIPFNYPKGTYPYNGLVMPPQPEIPFSDYDALGELGKYFAAPFVHNDFEDWADSVAAWVQIQETISDEEKLQILAESKKANAVMAYLAGIRYIDEQVGRLMDSLSMYPEIMNNTILLFTSDHGYAMDEKKHYEKAVLWENVIRVPLIICDLRNPGKQQNRNTVSLLDIYPTLCEYAGVNPPVFPDNTNYLDGMSLKTFIVDSAKKWERPVLTIMRNEPDRNGSCNEQYSVRTEKYHYIKYKSDGGDFHTECNPSLSETEEELYEIGLNRETDPYEWHNLAGTPDYVPVIQYMQSFLPDSLHYLKNMFRVSILLPEDAPCFYAQNEVISLTTELSDTSGNNMNINSGEFIFEWTNNVTSEILNTPQINFSLSSLSNADYQTHTFILFYLKVYDATSGALIAFNTLKAYINPLNTPSVNYCVITDSLTAEVTEYTMQGQVSSSSWDFGEGIQIDASLPGPYTYMQSGEYTVTNTVQYGNGCSLSFPFHIITNQNGNASDEVSCFVYPNPASEFVKVIFSDILSIEKIELLNHLGQTIKSENFTCKTDFLIYQLPDISEGEYLLQIISNTQTVHTKLIVM